MDISIWNGSKNGLIEMIDVIKKWLNSRKWKQFRWKKISTYFVGYNFSVISPECISIGNGFYAEDNLKLQAWKRYGDQVFSPEIIIGNNVSMMDNCHISCCKKIQIGDGCLLGSNVFITDNFHGNGSMEQLSIPPRERTLNVKGKVIIGKNVWIGRNVCIMPGVTIGDGATVGANAVVTKDIPAGSVAVGVPARVVRNIKLKE